MAKPEWGTKRVCLSCGAKFYDLMRSPILCPACGAEFDVEAAGRARRARPAARPLPETETVVPAEAEEVEEEGIEPLDELEAEPEIEEAEEVIEETVEVEEEDVILEDAGDLGEEPVGDVLDEEIGPEDDRR
ncbi:MAG: TIGR02300 family protein [Geminicoccaceae bacterium]|nr:TIGR02300 family protein [Geminicoccaceae bacterium]MDW8371422.1 TIGR02300 family protein [Geminicoccaceae bacterium]